MHLGNGAITPECGVVALGVAAAGATLAYATGRTIGLDRDRARTAGALGAAVFAAQLINVPILPFSSVHLIGGVLLAWMLGPALAVLTMASVLALQALCLGDGGVLAWGANLVNMGIVPALAVAALRRWAPAAEGRQARTGLLLGLTAFLATLTAAALIVGEVSIGRSGAQLEGIGQFAAWMLGAHALSGVLEGLTTVAVVRLLSGLAVNDERLKLSPQRAALVVAASLAVALVAAWGVTSSMPDGYQVALAATGQSGYALGSIETASQFTGLSATLEAWQQAVNSALPESEGVLFLTVTALAGLAAWLVARPYGRVARLSG